MWIVKNTLKATLTLKGLGVSVPAGQQLDLDVLGRERAEASAQVLVALEEGYLENVFKAAPAGALDDAPTGYAPREAAPRGMSSAELEAFKRRFLEELRETMPVAAKGDDLERVREAITSDVRQLVGEMKLLRERFESARGEVRHDPRLSDVEMRARLAFLEEQEQALLKNFESLGKRVEQEQADGDVMGKADLLSNL